MTWFEKTLDIISRVKFEQSISSAVSGYVCWCVMTLEPYMPNMHVSFTSSVEIWYYVDWFLTFPFIQILWWSAHARLSKIDKLCNCTLSEIISSKYYYKFSFSLTSWMEDEFTHIWHASYETFCQKHLIKKYNVY